MKEKINGHSTSCTTPRHHKRFENRLMATRGRPRHTRIYLEGYDRVWRTAKNVEELLPPLIASALHSEARRIMRASQQLVPRQTGALAATGYVEKPIFYGPVASVELGFSAPYAIKVHEMPRSGQTSGAGPGPRFQNYRSWATTGQWKYLEEPANDIMQTSKERIAAEVRLNLAVLSKLKAC